jgi:hypothetical protein
MKAKGSNIEEVDETISYSMSSFETVVAILGQARKMKQNHDGHCLTVCLCQCISVCTHARTKQTERTKTP